MTVTEMIDFMAGSTGIEPATSGLTVQCANQAAPRARLETSAGYTTPFRIANARCALNCARKTPNGLHVGLDAWVRDPYKPLGW